MHVIDIVDDGEWYHARCGCGWWSGGFKNRTLALAAGYTHKESINNSLDQQPGGFDDPHIGYY